MKTSYVYIITNTNNTNNTVLYIGVTSNLIKRIYEHKQKYVDGFSKKYNLDKLVYYETFDNILSAINREKRLKTWLRTWKNDLITQFNTNWKDLYNDIL